MKKASYEYVLTIRLSTIGNKTHFDYFFFLLRVVDEKANKYQLKCIVIYFLVALKII